MFAKLQGPWDISHARQATLVQHVFLTMLQPLRVAVTTNIMLCMAIGEVHLETIIKDLRERFACVDIRVSPPLVAFRESVYIEEEAPEPQHKPAKVLRVAAP